MCLMEEPTGFPDGLEGGRSDQEGNSTFSSEWLGDGGCAMN